MQGKLALTLFTCAALAGVLPGTAAAQMSDAAKRIVCEMEVDNVVWTARNFHGVADLDEVMEAHRTPPWPAYTRELIEMAWVWFDLKGSRDRATLDMVEGAGQRLCENELIGSRR